MAATRHLGNRIAPARFLLFIGMLVGSIAAATFIEPWWLSVMIGFDLSATVFILSCIPLLGHTHKEMRKVAIENDANRGILLLIASMMTIVILVSVGSQMASAAKTQWFDIALTIVTLLLAWVFGNSIYALHYSHLFYTSDDGGKDQAGIDFPGTKLPQFSDFVYFAFTIGSTLAVSDTNITSPHIRKVVTAHGVAGFIYNVGVFALTVNLLAGKS
jgi:uncharacterized membrane protein